MIGRTNAGGGANLNFKVVGGTAQPTSPSENTIWVNTDTEIISWEFNATEPEAPTEGMVWIQTGLDGVLSFNALKKNAIKLYPLKTMQCVSGAWAEKATQIHQGGVWTDMIAYIYNAGNTYDVVTGGWTIVNMSSGTGALNSDHIYLGYSGSSGRNATAFSQEKINFTGYQTLKAEVNILATLTASYCGCFLGVSSQNTDGSYEEFVAYSRSATTGTQTLSFDLSSYQGDYYAAISCSVANAEVYKMWLE